MGRSSSRIISLNVGKSPKAITVQEDKLRQTSSFFRAALDKHWKEGATGEVALPEDRLEIVMAYVEWLHRSTLVERSVDEGGEYSDAMWLKLIRMYGFGDKIQDTKFMNEVLMRVLENLDESNTCPHEVDIRLAYKSTRPGSSLRRLFVAAWAAGAKDHWFEAGDEYPEEFMRDLAMQLIRNRGKASRSYWVKQKDTWLEHE